MQLTHSQVADLYPLDVDGVRYCLQCGKPVDRMEAVTNPHPQCFPRLRPVVQERTEGAERIREYEDGSASRKCLACSTASVYDDWLTAIESPPCPCGEY